MTYCEYRKSMYGGSCKEARKFPIKLTQTDIRALILTKMCYSSIETDIDDPIYGEIASLIVIYSEIRSPMSVHIEKVLIYLQIRSSVSDSKMPQSVLTTFPKKLFSGLINFYSPLV